MYIQCQNLFDSVLFGAAFLIKSNMELLYFFAVSTESTAVEIKFGKTYLAQTAHRIFSAIGASC